MYVETHIVKLSKPAQRSLRDKVIYANIADLSQSINTKSFKVRGWELVTPASDAPVPQWRKLNAETGSDEYESLFRDNGAEYVYELYFILSYVSQADKKPGSQELHGILHTIFNRAAQASYGRWALTSCDDKSYVPPDSREVIREADLIGYADIEIPEDWDNYFRHLYGLTPHIGRIKSALEAGLVSGWRNRFNCALIGPPGCGKSDIAQSIKRALGDDAVMEFDATALTAAGAIKQLDEAEILPRVMIVEEIEKADPKALSFLLAMCDLRGEIRKTTARTNIQRDTKVFVIATVNNFELFCSLQSGALESRFSNKIWFKRPSRETLENIVAREIAKVGGDMAWIAPALDYCELANINDPRQVIALALCGRDQLVTGEYQAMLADTSQPTEDDAMEVPSPL